MRDGLKYRLGDLCDIIKGETPIKQAVSGHYPLVVTAAERSSHEEFQLDCRAVIVPLVSSTGHGHASIKRINYQEGKFALGSILCAVIPKDEKRLSAKFLHIYFSYFKDQLIVPLMKGSANVSLSIKALTELKIIVPPMNVQQRIISLAENDALMKPLHHEITYQQSHLAKLKQAIIQEAIQGKLTADWRVANPDVEPASQLLQRIQTEKKQLIAAKKLGPERPLPKISSEEIPFDIPKSWEWCRLLEISNAIHYGFTASAEPSQKDMRLLRITDIQDDHVDWESVPGCLCSETEKKKYLLATGDILIARTGGTVGKSFLVDTLPVQSIFASYLLRVVPSSLELAKFVKLYLGSPCYWSQLEDAARGAQPNVSGSKLKGLMLPLPPIAEQAAIVERVKALMQYCKQLESEISSAKKDAEMLIQAVLKEAFSGELND